MTSFTVMQFVDKLMVGQVGPLEVAAQGNGGVWSFVPIAVGMGIVTVVNTFVSQNFGAGRPEAGPKYAWAMIWLSLLMWVLVLLPMAAIMPLIFEAITSDRVAEPARLIAMETVYARILLIGGAVTLIGRGMHHYFFGLHRPKIIAVSAIVGNTVNVGVNYILIFGAAGLHLPWFGGIDLPGIPGTPALGLTGAALGTVAGTVFEVLIPLAVFLGPKMNAELRTRAQWRPSLRPMRDLWRLGWPAAMQYGNELLCWTLFMTVLVGHFGELHMTAGWIAMTFMHLSLMPAVGFSVAVTSLVGKYIGAGRPDVAVARARLGLAMAVGYMTVCAVLFVVFRHDLAAVFVGGDVTPDAAAEIIRITGVLLICAAVFQTIDAFGIVYSGALRGAGDTVWPGVMTMILSWTFIVGGGGAFVVFWPELESLGPWIGVSVYIIVYGIVMCRRFETGRWRSIRLLDDAATSATIGPGPPAAEADASIRDLAGEIAAEVAAEIEATNPGG
ncbi:MAG: MATE family efflux transporter, partial [Phycisphaerales bacterium]|nr:MATE family efflux transporter [Phycisphaerales bacterium]